MQNTNQNDFQRRYPTLDMIRYGLQHAWQTNRLLIPLGIIVAILLVVTPFIGIFLPKLVIQALEQPSGEREQIINIIIGATALLMLVGLLGHAGSKYFAQMNLRNRLDYTRGCVLKTFSMDYDKLEDPRGQTARSQAGAGMYNDTMGPVAQLLHMRNLLQHLFGLVLYSYLVAQLNPLIILALLAASLLSFCASRASLSYEAKHREDYNETKKRFTYVRGQSQMFANAKDLRLYGMSGWFIDHLQQYSTEMEEWVKRFQLRHFGTDVLGDLLNFLRDGLAYAYLINLVLNGQIAVSDFTLYFAAIAGISSWANQLSTDLSSIYKASAELGLVRNFLELPDKPQPQPGLPLPQSYTPEIIFDQLSFRYPGAEKWTLRNFNLRIAAGEKLALVGINGAGKTTLIKLLCGLYEPTEGRILIDGIDSRQFHKEDLFRLFSVVFQEVRPLALDVKQNVALAPADEIDRERVERCLEMAGLSERIADMPQGLESQLTRILAEDGIELSGGQAQKLMLARALYKQGSVIIMDEPTAALDPIAEAEMYERYSEMISDKSSIYISHRLASTRFCDRIAFLSEGQISELGSHDELMALNGQYAHMFKVQSHYYQDEIEDVEQSYNLVSS